MNLLYVAAACLAILVAAVHSILGEVLIFRRMRQGGIIPTNGARLIGEGHVRILWASWHVLSVFGIGMAAVLFWLAGAPQGTPGTDFLANAVIAAMAVGSALVFVGTRARHPGWAGLLVVALLTWLAKA